MPFADENDIPASCSASNINAKPAQTFMGLVSTDILQFNQLFSTMVPIEELEFMRVSRKFCYMGSNSENFFFLSFLGEERDPNNTKREPSSAHQRNTI